MFCFWGLGVLRDGPPVSDVWAWEALLASGLSDGACRRFPRALDDARGVSPSHTVNYSFKRKTGEPNNNFHDSLKLWLGKNLAVCIYLQFFDLGELFWGWRRENNFYWNVKMWLSNCPSSQPPAKEQKLMHVFLISKISIAPLARAAERRGPCASLSLCKASRRWTKMRFCSL